MLYRIELDSYIRFIIEIFRKNNLEYITIFKIRLGSLNLEIYNYNV